MEVKYWRRRVAVCVAGGLFLTSPVVAQGTSAEREACTPDVFRLCSSFIPDATSITTCLKRKKPDLSEPCRKVIFPQAQLDETSARAGSRMLPTR